MATAGTLKFEIVVDAKKGTAEIVGVDGKVKKLQKTTKTASTKMGNDFKSLWKKIALGAAAFAILTAGFNSTIKAATSFQDEVANVNTLLPATGGMIGGLSEGMLDLAGPLGSATELTKGLYQALSASVDPAKAVDFITESAKFAKASLTEMTPAVDVLTTAINAYGLRASDVTEVSDILFQVIKDGKTTGSELAASLGMVIPSAATMGVSLRELGATMAIMTKSGIGTSEAVTALNGVLMGVLSPAKEVSKAAERLKIDFTKAGIEGAGGLQKWLALVKERVGENTVEFGRLFPNVRGLKSVFALTGSAAKDYANQMVKMNNVNNNTNIALEKQLTTFSAVSEGIKNKLQAVFIKEFLPVLENIAKYLQEDSGAIIEFGKTTSSVLVGLIGFMVEFRKGLSAIGGVILAVFSVVKLLAWKTAIVAALSAPAAAVATLAAGLSGIVVALGYATAAVAAFVGGWIIGNWIQETIDGFFGITKAIAAISKEEMKLAEQQSLQKARMTGLGVANTFLANNLKRVAVSLGENSNKMSDQAIAISKNREAYDGLRPKLKSVVDGFVASRKAVSENIVVEKISTTTKAKLQAAIEAKKKAMESARAAIEAQNKAYEEMAGKMGVITRTSFPEIQNSTKILTKVFGENREQISKNPEALKAVSEEAKRLSEAHKGLGRVVPPELKKITAETAKLSKEGVEAYEDMAKEMGIITTASIPKLNKEVENLSKVFEKNKEQIEKNPKILEEVRGKVEKLTGEYGTAGDRIPPALIEITRQTDAMGKTTTEAYEDIASAMGILTDKGIAALNSEVKDLTEVFEKNKEQIKDNPKLLENIRTRIKSLTSEYGTAKDKIPQSLRDIDTETKNLQSSTAGLVSEFSDLANSGGSLIGSLTDMGAVSKGFGSRISGVVGGIDSFSSALTDSQQPAKKTSGFMGSLGGVIGKLGPYGAMAGAALKVLGSVFKGLFGSTMIKDAISDLEEFGDISSQLAKKIEDLAETLKETNSTWDAAQAAISSFYDEVIKESDVTVENFDHFAQRTQDILADYDRNALNLSETTEALGGAWNALMEEAIKLGTVGSQSLLDIMGDVNNRGIEVVEIQEWVNKALEDGAKGYADYLSAGFSDATMPVYQEMLDYQKLLADNSELVAGVKGWEDALMGLSGTSKLTQEQFDSFSQGAIDGYNALISQGFTANQAMEQLGPTLSQLAFLEKEHGLVIDDTTKALIEQGREAGTVSDDMRTDNEKMLDGMDRIAQSLDKIAYGFGFGVPNAVNEAASIITKSSQNIVNSTNSISDSIDNVIGNTGNMADAIVAADSIWGKAVSGNSIVPENRKISASLVDATENIGHMAEAIKDADTEFTYAADSIVLDNEAIRESLVDVIDETRIGLGGELRNLKYEYGTLQEELTNANSIWREELEDIERQMATALPGELETLEDQYRMTMLAMQSDTGDLNSRLEAVGQQAILTGQNLKDVIDAQASLTSGEVGSKYGIYTEEEKQGMSLEYAQMRDLWAKNRIEIAGSKNSMQRFLNDLKKLTVMDEYDKLHDEFTKSVGQWNTKIQAGEIRTETGWEKPEELADGTGGWREIKRPTPIIVGERGTEYLNVVPQSKLKSGGTNDTNDKGGGDTYIINLNIYGNQGASVAEEFVKALKANRHSVKTEIIKAVRPNGR